MIDMILATKFRPARLKKVVDNLFEHSTNLNTRLILTCDYDDPFTLVAAYEIINKYPGRVTLLVNNFYSKGPVAALNNGVNLVTQKYLTYFADDCSLYYHGWDDHAIQLLAENPEYMCLNLRSNQNNNILPFIDIEYAYTFVINTEKFKQLGLFDPIYKRYFGDPDFFLTMIWEGEIMMTSKNIVFDHIYEADYLFKENNKAAPPEDDLEKFKNKWEPRANELVYRFSKIKDKWNKLV